VIFDLIEFVLEFFTERVEFKLAILILNDDFLLQEYFCDEVFILLGEGRIFMFQMGEFLFKFLILFIDLVELIFDDIV
jgi:hypothetical protein